MVAQICLATGKIRRDEEGTSLRKLSHSSSLDLDNIQININWEDVTCPICLDFPHNGVLLQCSSYDNGCRPFMCDTDHTHSNCLNRFKSASGVPQAAECLIASEASTESTQMIPSTCESRPACPLCRGEVTGWVIIKEARAYLNMKKRCCQEKQCYYMGNFVELQRHALLKHPHSRPSEIDPARQLDWENFQQSSDIIDVLSTIHAEVPHGVVLGDYVIEYGDDEDGDDYDDFGGRGAKWWSSCILYQVFGKLRCSGNRRRSRGRNLTRSRVGSSSNGSNEGSPSSLDTAVYRFRQVEDEVPGMAAAGDHAVASREVIDRHSYSYSGRISR
ncbi:hypothetical protein KFK09_015616 [Dendrobium nobile]|uniref:Uncharacterized protein n=1 Tax=Dendrobium nobile TaxID=94219 RepID=A0A8T3B5A2_DENNO|nr:hypothetical protein KFK09_015616 [Dendrobium nobile]